ncbi:ribonuclease P protein subunit p30 isoform 5-T5 [Menidia menidia]
MAAFMDLNVVFPADSSRLRGLVQTAAHLGYSTIALNYVFEPTNKKKQEVPAPRPLGELIGPLPLVQGRCRPIRVLHRLTVVMSDSSHFRPNAPEYRRFDLLAVRPTTEKLFHAACLLYEVDIVCITVTEKLPFFFKRAPISGSLILSSAAEQVLELRGPHDVSNLALLFGMSDADARDAVSSTCRAALLHAETRRTASGAVQTVKIPEQAHGEEPVAKRARPSPGPGPA